jgi:hypothetical protein
MKPEEMRRRRLQKEIKLHCEERASLGSLSLNESEIQMRVSSLSVQ